MLVHELLLDSASRDSDRKALGLKKDHLAYAELAELSGRFAAGTLTADLEPSDRIAVYLPKTFETVIAFFGASSAGGVFVPVNPLLKPAQVAYILKDCNVRILVTSRDRLRQIAEELHHCSDLHTVVVTGEDDNDLPDLGHINVVEWRVFIEEGNAAASHRRIDTDVAAIFYTSGSTGNPKGVVLSHRNMVAGAHSVASYLENSENDRLLAVLPFSFDYGFSQLSTAFLKGAAVILMDYLLPRDVIRAVDKHRITGLAGVPPLWNQLCKLDWPDSARETLRYITNSGGAMPTATLASLRERLPNTRPYLMYGLTEAFRSTFLPPEELDRRPTSMGKAIPNAEIMVVREDGTACAPGEPGELVHRGALVSLGYWNDPERTKVRFRPVPGQLEGKVLQEFAVWSGDTVKMDEDGFLYFIGRKDDMIKTSGYRVSPTEIEEVVYTSGLVSEVAALGVPHPELGQAIVLVAVALPDGASDDEPVLSHCRAQLPNFMAPFRILWRDKLPRNPNGKIDRKTLTSELEGMFGEAE
ncbi:MAG: acyl-CoA ligase (AMP-forming), exosortase A system-associated [Chromatiales bacterium]|nr:acyl-CoA ligase (AMP-forming), exosortase A system-associated [Chromatiales bacterium]